MEGQRQLAMENDIKQIMHSLADMANMKVDICNQVKKDVDMILETKLNEKLLNLKTELAEVKSVVLDQKVKIKNLEKQNLQLEILAKKKNIIMFNVPESDNENTVESATKLIDSTIEEPVSTSDIDSAFRLGKQGNNKRRPILVKFMSERTRAKVLKNVKNFVKNKISVYEDLPKCISDLRKKVSPLVKKLQKDGKKVYYNMDTFKVNGVEWSYDQVEKALSEINNVAMKRGRSVESSPELSEETTVKTNATGAIPKKFALESLVVPSTAQ